MKETIFPHHAKFQTIFLHTKLIVVLTLIDALKDVESLEQQLKDLIDGHEKNEEEIKQTDEKSTIFVKSEIIFRSKKRVSFCIVKSIVH